MANHYDTLCVSPSAPPEVVRAAYLQLAKLYHPDSSSPDEERMKAINEAWHVLGSPTRRALYDAERTLAEREVRSEPAQAAPGEPTLGREGWGEEATPAARDSSPAGFPLGGQGWGEVVDDPQRDPGRAAGPPPAPAAGPIVRPLGPVGAVAAVALGIFSALSLAVALTLLARSRVYQGMLDDQAAGLPAAGAAEELRAATSQVSLAVTSGLLAGTVALVAFVAWQHRHAVNAEAISGPYGMGPRWVLVTWLLLPLCCLVPAVSLVLAGMQLHLASQASNRRPASVRVGVAGGGGSPLVILCGTLLAAAVQYLSIGLGSPLLGDPDDLDRLSSGEGGLDPALVADRASMDTSTAVWWGVLAAGSSLSILMVRRLTRRQAARLAELAAFGP